MDNQSTTAMPRPLAADMALCKALEFWQAQGFTPSEMHGAMTRFIANSGEMNADLQEFAYAHNAPALTDHQWTASQLDRLSADGPGILMGSHPNSLTTIIADVNGAVDGG